MNGNYKRCPEGHYYQGDYCPFCHPNQETTSNQYSTQNPAGDAFRSSRPTDGFGTNPGVTGNPDINQMDRKKTRAFHPNETEFSSNAQGMGRNTSPGSFYQQRNSTVFGNESGEVMDQVQGNKPYRKLVGWLVSYSNNKYGEDYKLYEGRNVIGRNSELCDIVVPDMKISGKHAILLNREGKFMIKDEFSSHGTFLNGNSIALGEVYLQDGDEIRMGDTIFKLRTAF